MKALTNSSFRLKEGGLFRFVGETPPKAAAVDGPAFHFTAENDYYSPSSASQTTPPRSR